MEPAFRAFRFFALTIGKNPGVYDSFEEACSQLVGLPKTEYQSFNIHLLAEGAFTAQIEAIQDEKECVEEMQALLGDPKMSPPPSPPYIPTTDGRIAPLRVRYSKHTTPKPLWVNLIPVDEVASFPFPMCVDIEHWLAKICYDTSLPPPAYFR
ncbi:hypothetical protein PIB30_080060 [Stylosanthes scabra]|uniref:Ribonuclease H1 N-terminal domain-containing protein n=1 Tax=Stylosanthes scabra TaxID=79078 RepID=A0ABU6TQX1_9FABA|nr:hypothetical protein [Stylosanthes scabra]